jgi:hypothetical protein
MISTGLVNNLREAILEIILITYFRNEAYGSLERVLLKQDVLPAIRGHNISWL